MPLTTDAADRSLLKATAEQGGRLGAALPRILPQDITWTGGLDRQPLVVHLEFTNPSATPTRPTKARLRVASFGAFRPWRPFADVVVPAMAPRSRATVRAQVPEVWVQRLRADPLNRPGAVVLAANIDVLVRGSAPVEVHRGMRAELQPGCTNVICCAIGSPRVDAQAHEIHLLRAPDAWEVQGWLVGSGDPSAPSTADLREAALHASFSHARLMVSVPVPAEATDGEFAIAVCRPATGEEAVVELRLVTPGALS